MKDISISVPIIPDYLCSLEGNASIVTAEDENGRVGLLLSSKAFIQLILNPAVGIYIGNTGYAKPLFFGNMCLLITTLCKHNYSYLIYIFTYQIFSFLFRVECI